MTVLYTTHYMEEAQELSNRIAIMDQGKIIACGTHIELIQVVGEMDRIDLTLNASSDQIEESWRKMTGVHHLLTENGGEGNGPLTLLVEDSNVLLPRLFESASQQGVRITSVNIQEPNLEAVFLHLTGKALRD
jgi:ABC-2 type transport system ATP-binding protein